MTDIITCLIEGLGHQRAGRPDRAEAIYRDVLEREPAQPNALYLYGLLKLQDGRSEDAAALLQTATQFRGDPEVRLHLARARLASGDPVGALSAVEEGLAAGAPRGEVLYLRGTALNAAGRPEEAIEALKAAAALEPRHASIRLNLANAQTDLDLWDAAEANMRAAVALDPALVEAHASLGFVLTAQGRLDEAITACRTAVGLDPLSAEAHWNLATALLLAGDYQRGFSEYEWHRKHPLFRAYWRELPGRAWNGESLEGQTLLVHAGQGMGDTIQLARYAPELQARGARVVLACSRALLPLLREQAGIAAVVPLDGPLPFYDVWVDQMSLPRLLQARPESIPGGDGYFRCDEDLRRRWADRVGGRRVGFAWAGNPQHANDRRRSLPLGVAQEIARPGMVSLQVGSRAGEAAALGILDVSGELSDYAETAGLIASLDLVITVDTSVAHLAGALGVPTWLLLPVMPDWRWIAGRDDTPWYRSVRLIRQGRSGEWADVVSRVAAGLAEDGRG